MNGTNRDKIFWPEEGYTKGDVIDYYRAVAPYILPYLRHRPESLNRHPDGIQGPHFYQKSVARIHLPPFVKTKALRARSVGKTVRYALIENKESLLYFANLGCIEFNPWASQITSIDTPDYLTFDLDPDGASFNQVIAVAQQLHALLEELNVPNCCKTSGKRGLHVMVPLGEAYSYDKARKFAKTIADRVAAKMPRLATTEARIRKRHGRVYLDIARNAYGQTTAAPYSLRPYPGATVSTPLQWKEVKRGLSPAQFTIRTMLPRLKQKGDLMKGVWKKDENVPLSLLLGPPTEHKLLRRA